MIKRKFGRKKAHREHMLANLATSVILFEHVKTTKAKAKEVSTIVQKLIDLGKKNNLTSKRRLIAYLPDKLASKKIIEDLAKRYSTRVGGYLQSYNMGVRAGDGSQMVMLKLIAKVKTPEEPKNDKKIVEDNKEKKNK